MDFCSVNNNNDDDEVKTCFSLKSLIKLAQSYNDQYKTNPITIRHNKKYLHSELQKRFSDKCEFEWCWISDKNIKIDDHEIEHLTFKPKGPKKKHDWLSNFDIDAVMKQYEKKYPDFMFFGPVPIDFSKIYTELNELNFNRLLNKNITKIGIVFNTDVHTGSGIHWISSFLDLKNGSLEFFDSVGDEPPREVLDFLHNSKKKLDTLLPFPTKIKINRIAHQFGNNECGVYSLHFIIKRLTGNSMEEIITHVKRDKEMNQCRKTYFI